MIQVHTDSLWCFRMMKCAYRENIHYAPSFLFEDVDRLAIYSGITGQLGQVNQNLILMILDGICVSSLKPVLPLLNL